MNIRSWTFGFAGGLIALLGFLVVLWFIGSEETDHDALELLGWAFILLSYIPVLLGMHRAFHKEGRSRFWAQFGLGLLMSAIVAGSYSLSWVVFFQTEEGKVFTERMWEQESRKIQIATELTAEQVIQKQADLRTFREWYQRPLVAFLVTFLVESFPVGLLLSLLAAIYWGRKARHRHQA
jgi:hypothetical protein